MTAYLVHLRTLSGHARSLDDTTTSSIAEVTCPTCVAAIDRIGLAYQAARRSAGVVATPARRGPRRLLEELGNDGQWHLFDVRRWCREKLGEYAITVRVRDSARGER